MPTHIVTNPRPDDVALSYPPEVWRICDACHFSVFWNNGVMARPGATYLESIIIIVITLKQNIK